jgi:hypothetical protein
MKTSFLRPSLLVVAVIALEAGVSAQSIATPKPDAVQLSISSQGSSAPAPDPGLQFSLWQQTSQSTTSSADPETQFKLWQSQRTSADSINLFKCTTSTDLDNPECVGKLPGTNVIGTKDAKMPTTLPVRKKKTGDPD